jgi:hypothetical protein
MHFELPITLKFSVTVLDPKLHLLYTPDPACDLEVQMDEMGQPASFVVKMMALPDGFAWDVSETKSTLPLRFEGLDLAPS